jgi:hypothetical protein
MKRGSRGFAGQVIRAEVVLAAILSLVSSGSVSVLCIAPGSHIAIEDINAPCCSSDRVPSIDAQDARHEFELTDSCERCTDLLIAGFGREAIHPSRCDFARDLLAREFLKDRAPEISFSLSGQISTTAANELAPVSSCPPLRC